ncbi:MAG: zinc-ribbon domain-containing protein [Deltaproteobacteria bacterium]|nr:zinc-ribbon domain-containing protein [Deltaproteobacteria bacterium]
MKITCPSCSARYSIDDAKVKGKAFKFTCKKCGQTHVYRDTPDGAAAAVPSAAAAPAAAAPAPAGGEEEAVWFVAVGEEQQGPYTTQQIREYIQTDQLDPESFMWKEGMEDWLPVQQVPDFADAVPAGGAPPAAPSPPAGSPFGGPTADEVTVASPFSAAALAQSDAGDLFAFGGGAPAPASAAKASGGPADPSPFGAFGGGGGGAAAVASRGGADLFGAKAQPSPFETTGEEREEDVMMGAAAAAAPSPRVDARQMIGQRNENSVLFSLSSLQALGAGKPAAASGASAPRAAGFASGEGSGLIDIKAMAGAVVRTEEKHDDLFGFGGGSGGIGAPVAVPILTRPIRHEEESKKPMFILIGVIGFFVVAIVILLVFLLGKDDEKPTAPTQVVIADAGTQGLTEEEIQARIAKAIAEANARGQADAGAAAPTEDKDTAGTTAAADAGATPDGDPSVKVEDAGPDTGEEPASGSDGGRNPRRDGRATTERDAGGGTPSNPPTERDSGGGSQQRDTRVVGSLEGLGRRDAGGGGSSELPATPDRNAVKRQLDSVNGAVRACAGGQAGTASVSLVIQGSTGRVTRVNVTGDFQGAAATCISNAIRGLTFPQFSNTSQDVNYRYTF